MLRVCDRLSRQPAMPRASARAWALPVSRSVGSPDGWRSTSISVQSIQPAAWGCCGAQPVPSALLTASLAAQRAASEPARPAQ